MPTALAFAIQALVQLPALIQALSDHGYDRPLLEKLARKNWLNDLHPGLYAFYRALRDQFDDFAAHFRSPNAGSVALALRFLREWFEYHIEFYDAPMARWINEQGEPRR